MRKTAYDPTEFPATYDPTPTAPAAFRSVPVGMPIEGAEPSLARPQSGLVDWLMGRGPAAYTLDDTARMIGSRISDPYYYNILVGGANAAGGGINGLSALPFGVLSKGDNRVLFRHNQENEIRKAIDDAIAKGLHPRVVGHSYGGGTVANIAKDYPDVPFYALDPVGWFNRPKETPRNLTVYRPSGREYAPKDATLSRLAPIFGGRWPIIGGQGKIEEYDGGHVEGLNDAMNDMVRDKWLERREARKAERRQPKPVPSVKDTLPAVGDLWRSYLRGTRPVDAPVKPAVETGMRKSGSMAMSTFESGFCVDTTAIPMRECLLRGTVPHGGFSSMTRYEQGFMRKCAEYGVDGRRFLDNLMKMADSEEGRLADIGSYTDNGWQDGMSSFDDPKSPQKGSYVSELLKNGPWPWHILRTANKPRILPLYAEKDKYFSEHFPVINKDLEHARSDQALHNAASFFPVGSAPEEAIRKNLIRAGEQNHQNYKRTGSVPKRDSPDRTGIEELKLSPGQLKQLLIMQNTMAQNAGRRPVTTA